ncbi:MAG TPA: Trm112 family protein [Allosphingosinicella sp.]|jgi:hypothetical protein
MTDELAALLVCPITRTGLRWNKEASMLVSDEAGLAYPVRQGVPVLLAEAAKPLNGQAAQ